MNGQQPIPSPDGKVSPLIPISAVPDAAAGRDLAYERRLLSLWIDEVKRTGEIDYPELVQFLDRVYEVEVAPPGSVLMPERGAALAENLRRAQADVREAAAAIASRLNALAAAVDGGALDAGVEAELRSQIRSDTEQFLRGVEYLLDTAHRYAVEPPSVWKRWRWQAPDAEAETVRKWSGDLDYIRQYVAQQGQVGVLAGEFRARNLTARSFRRLHKYLEVAPGLADLLGHHVRRVLERKGAGTDEFSAPADYSEEA